MTTSPHPQTATLPALEAGDATRATPRNLWRSTGALVAGFLSVVVLSLGTDQLLHLLEVYPPWGQPMHEPGLNLLALAYRIVYTVLGSYLTARLAPRAPMRHVWVLSGLGCALAVLGVIATIPLNLGPAWYPIALAVTALPCGWLGGTLYLRGRRGATTAG